MILGLLKAARMRFIRWKYRRFLVAGSGFTCGRGTIFYARTRIRMGENVYFGRYCNVETDAEIGNEVLIANGVALVGRLDHDIHEVGTPIRFARSIRDPEYRPDPGKLRVVIGDDVWIGFGAVVLSGVRIGSGSVIAAGALVVEDVQENMIVGGVPARVLGTRFPPDVLQEHRRKCAARYSSYRSGAA